MTEVQRKVRYFISLTVSALLTSAEVVINVKDGVLVNCWLEGSVAEANRVISALPMISVDMTSIILDVPNQIIVFDFIPILLLGN